MLNPYESTQIKYIFHVPIEKEKMPVHVFKLHLVDPSSGDKFGDPMTAVCTIIDSKKKNTRQR